MSVRLSGDAGGDPPDPPAHAGDSICLREFELKDEKSKIPSTQIPRHFDSEFIAPVFRERLREIIHKSPNPEKSSYLRSKFADFLNHGYRVECV